MMTSTKPFWELWPTVKTGGVPCQGSTLIDYRQHAGGTFISDSNLLPSQTYLHVKNVRLDQQTIFLGRTSEIRLFSNSGHRLLHVSMLSLAWRPGLHANGALKCSHWVVTQLAQSQCVRWPHIGAAAQRKVGVVRCEIYCFETRSPPRRSPGSLDHPRVDSSTNMFVVPLSFGNTETETSVNHRITTF